MSDTPIIVVVDDEVSICRALSRLMLSAGLRVESFASGQQLFEYLKTTTPDCIVLDLHMPQMSGFEVQNRLNQEGWHIPIVTITGHDTPESRQRVMEAGASAHLVKPVGDEALLEAVRWAIHSSNGNSGH